MIRIGRPRDRLGRQHQRLERAFVDQPVDHAGRDAGLLRRFALGAQPCRRRAAASTRARAGVMRCGGGPASRTPTRSRAGPRCRPCAAPCAAPCRAATACSPPPSRRNLRSSSRSGGTSSLASTSLSRLCRPGGCDRSRPRPRRSLRARRAAPRRRRPARGSRPARHAVGIGMVERDRHQNIDECAWPWADADWPIPARLRKGEAHRR